MNWVLATLVYWVILGFLMKGALTTMHPVFIIPVALWACLFGPAICISIGMS